MGQITAHHQPLNRQGFLNDIVEISHHYGSDPAFVIAGGGNTSVKDDHSLFVKGSGTSLGTITPEGFVGMCRRKLSSITASAAHLEPKEREALFLEKVMDARLWPRLKQRPSVEVVLHNLLPDRLVVHTHPTAVNQLTCAENGEELCNELFHGNVLWVPYVDPGCLLAKTVEDLFEAYMSENVGNQPTAILLQNHGLFIGGGTAKDVLASTRYVIDTIAERLAGSAVKAPFGSFAAASMAQGQFDTIAGHILSALEAEGLSAPVSASSRDADVMEFVSSSNGKTAALGGPLTPDQIVYCKVAPLWIGSDEGAGSISAQVVDFMERYESLPRTFLIENGGLLTVGENQTTAANCLAVYRDAIDVMRGAASLGGIHPMSEEAAEFIRKWEVEAYRAKISNG